MARAVPISRQVDIWKSKLTGEQRRQMMIEAAHYARGEALAQDTRILGRVPTYQTFVDGRSGASEETVRRGGTIAYVFAVGAVSLEQAADDTYRTLLTLSPRLTGRYAKSHQMLVNDVPTSVAVGVEALRFQITDVISFTNFQPYARKIEKGLSDQAPNGIYEVTAASIQARYGSVVKVEFTYEGYLYAPAVGSNRKGGRLKTRADFDRARRYPTITLSVK